MREKTFENKVKRYLESIGAYYVKQFGCSYTAAGTPDLLCCVNGHFVAIEVKSDKGKPSVLQCHKIKQIVASGGIAYVLYPDDFLDFKRDMENLL